MQENRSINTVPRPVSSGGPGTAGGGATSKPKAKTTGVYGGDLVPGTYVKTRTGTTRGEELFSRPDLERPWRSVSAQRRASAVALKEREIEELMRLCSALRTELGNVRSDARYAEYAAAQQSAAALAAKDAELERLRGELAAQTRRAEEAAEATAAEVRLLKAQHENELQGLRTEARLAGERARDVAAAGQKQVDDLKAAAARELEFVEARFKARSEELAAELAAVRATNAAADDHARAQATAAANLLGRVEADYKERLRSAEQSVEEVRTQMAADLASERAAKEAALAEARKSVEELAAAVLDREEVVGRAAGWNAFVLSALDAVFARVAEALPEAAAVVPADPQLHQIPALYGPRALMQEPEGKLCIERIVYRLLQLKAIPFASLTESGSNGNNNNNNNLYGGGELLQVDENGSPVGGVAAELARVGERQERLRRALAETRTHCEETDAALSAVLGRLHFFSSNLQAAVTGGGAAFSSSSSSSSGRRGTAAHATAATVVLPPLRNVMFVLVSIPQGPLLWALDAEVMRTAVMLLHSTLRLKAGEYGAYECYSDDVCMLLACGDAGAACRLCCDCQEWLLALPWPEGLTNLGVNDSGHHNGTFYSSSAAASPLVSVAAAAAACGPHASVPPAASGGTPPDSRHAAASLCPTEMTPDGSRPLYRGLRVAMTLHTGEAFVEPTAIPNFTTAFASLAAAAGGGGGVSDDTNPNAHLGSGGSGGGGGSAVGCAYRCHYYGRAVSQLIHAGALTQGGQILATEPAWAACLRHKHTLGQLAVTRLGPFPILSFDSATGHKEKQTLELVQLAPWSLKDRVFAPTAKMALPAVSALSGATRSLLAAELEALRGRREALGEARALLSEEHTRVAAQAARALARARQLLPRFHLLPPPDMVQALNELYAATEHVVERSEGLAEDVRLLAAGQEDLAAQGEGLRTYYAQRHNAGEAREEDLRAELEALQTRYEAAVKEMGARARAEVGELRAALQEKEQTIRRLCQSGSGGGGGFANSGSSSGGGGGSVFGRGGQQQHSSSSFSAPAAAAGGYGGSSGNYNNNNYDIASAGNSGTNYNAYGHHHSTYDAPARSAAQVAFVTPGSRTGGASHHQQQPQPQQQRQRSRVGK